MIPHLTLYTRPGCHLCEDAWRQLDVLATEFDWSLSKVDISDDADLLRRFGPLIPVVDVEGGSLLYAPLTMEALLDAVAVASQAAS